MMKNKINIWSVSVSKDFNWINYAQGLNDVVLVFLVAVAVRPSNGTCGRMRPIVASFP